MSSLALPTEARCKRLVLKAVTGQTNCAMCQGTVTFRREYGWCASCRTKIRPKAATWFRGSNLRYQQMYLLLWCWQQR